ncbi:metal-dependent transcriptional regulator [Blautia sp. MSJ-19]|uniref:metal-dependent transcriptional regulator n=1 Tax=Blautia sp. MSJ-19 TaxID=2841517 RepID=UPI001C0EA4FE|nr:iron dependent repressor, metal binding and dimerization domain protein [Blautia sp. MSJ-19]MBU5480377.1 hypothetical protein [Blautia sp. MSJ-19]
MQKVTLPTRIGLDMPSSHREIEEDLLEELCRISQRKNLLTIQDISAQLNFSEKELTYYIRQMKRHGYVELSPEGKQICITELGRITGAECSHRHETFMQFLQFVGVESETAREDACRIEHIVSEETVRQICNFMNYGETFERVLRYTDLSYRYDPGEYAFLMGIYYMEKTYPRRFAREFQNFSENIRLHVEEDRSWFELEPTGDHSGHLWYQEQKQWVCAQEHDGRPVLPSDIFEFTLQRQDPIIEGNVLIAFARDGEYPLDWNTRELDVHIW